MNIFLLNRRYYPAHGGIETSLYQISKELSSEDFDISILSFGNNIVNTRNEYAKTVYIPKNMTRLLKVPFISQLYESCLLYRYLKTLHQAQIGSCVFISRNSMMACVAERVFPGRVIFAHSMDVKQYEQYCYGGKRNESLLTRLSLHSEIVWQTRALKKCKHHVVFRDGIRKQLSESSRVNPEQIHVIAPGISFHETSQENTTKNCEEITFLSVGRLDQNKNAAITLSAFSKLRNSNVNLIYVGDGVQRIVLEETAKLLGIADRVRFAGVQDNTQQYYKNATYLVSSSRYESFGQVIIEAMAFGTPVIGFRNVKGITNTAAEDLIENGVQGYLADAYTADALAEIMQKAVSIVNTDKYTQMRANCLDAVRKYSTWKEFALKCINIVEEQQPLR